MPIIELTSCSKWYGEVIGLNNVTAGIADGITALVGPNGAGKSTMMGLAIGQLHPSQGHICVFGENPWNRPPVLSRIGYCPEGDPFWPHLTGRQFVSFLARMSGLYLGWRRRAVREAIERCGMTAHMDRPVRGYSKGMRQRIKIAQALVHRPDLLILDEPFTGADPVARHELAALFKQLAKEGVHILISSHVLHEVEALTRRILMIDHGRIVAQGDMRSVREEMGNQPHAIRIRVDQPRVLAAELAQLEGVRGLRLDEEDTLIVETAAPEELYARFPAMALDRGLTPIEIAPADDSLEALFGYLTKRG